MIINFFAIGKEGQNVRFAAKLTNWKIDIKSKSQARSIRRIKEGFFDESKENTFKNVYWVHGNEA